MANYIATILNVEAESNPEYACVPLEAKDDKAATKAAKELLTADPHGLGWTSFADPELWGKVQRVVVDVVSEEEHVKRSGKGNTRGSEGQDARFERFRKAAKV
jgi:hypothetical protein